MEFLFDMPVRLFAQQNAVEKHQEEFGKYGKRCLIVTGHNSAKACGALDDVTKALDNQGIAWKVFDQVGQNPLVSVCYQGGREAIAFGADFIVGIGGGSPLDAAKAVAAFGADPELTPEGLYQPHRLSALPLLLVGTTAGTGSEVTRFSVLTDDKGHKRSWGNASSYARASFGDPRYTLSLNRKFTLSTGLDAVAHALESYFSVEGDQVSQSFAMMALKLLLPALKEVWLAEGEPTLEFRERLYLGSLYGGMAINRTGTAFCHTMGYWLSEERKIPHGFACAVFLPDFIQYTVPLAPEKAMKLFSALGMYAQELCDTIIMLTDAEYEPATDEELEGLLDRWENSPNMKRTPGSFDRQQQRRIAEKVLQKKG